MVVAMCSTHAWQGHEVYNLTIKPFMPSVAFDILLTLLYGITPILVHAPLLHLGGKGFCNFALSTLGASYDAWREDIKSTSNINAKKDEFGTKWANTGCSIIELQKRSNKVYGGILFLFSAHYLVAITMYSYGAFLIFFNDLAMNKLAISAFYITCSAYYAYNLYILCSSGQTLIDAQEEARETLEEAFYENRWDWNVQTRDKICLLMTKMGKDKPMTPLGFYSLTKQGFLSTMALVFTYLIVLLQFKAA